jgi:hypothetical protein
MKIYEAWEDLKAWLITEREEVDGTSDPMWCAYDSALNEMEALELKHE